MTITSRDNEKLKLVRKLAERKHRKREGLFVTEGEDLLAAGLAAGVEPKFILSTLGSGLGGEEVEPALLDGVSALGSGTRVIAAWPIPAGASAAGPAGDTRVWVYLHGLADPGNVGTVIRSADALAGAVVALGPGSADPYGPKAVRASMGAIFTTPVVTGCAPDSLPRPRIAMVSEGGDTPGPVAGPAAICMGAEREGLPEDLVAECELRWTIPMRGGATGSLNVAAAAAIALERISSGAAQDGPVEGAG